MRRLWRSREDNLLKKNLSRSALAVMTALAFALAGCAGDTTTYVKKGVQSVVIAADKGAVHTGDMITLTATVTPADAYYDSVMWNSTDDAILIHHAGNRNNLF